MKNVFFSAQNNVGQQVYDSHDTGHGRLDKCRTAIFSGATAPTRLSKFISTYANNPIFTGDANVPAERADPAKYTNTDIGLPISCVISVYFADGMWYLIYQDHNPYNQDTMPFNQVPNPFDDGNAQ